MLNRFYTLLTTGTPCAPPEHFWSVFMLSMLVAIPLLSGNVYYLDDYHRLVNGSVNYWINNGRPLAALLTWLLNCSYTVSDMSPLPLVLGLAGLAMGLVFSCPKLTRSGSGYSVLICLSVILSPFFAQSMLYAYDSLSILSSVALAFMGSVPLSLRKRRQYLASFSLFLGALCLYQTAVNYAFINLLLTAMLAITRGKNVGRECTHALTVLLALASAALVYRLIIVPLCVTDAYNQTRSLAITLNADGIKTVTGNIAASLQVIRAGFPGYSALPVAIIFLSGTAGCWKTGYVWMMSGDRRGLSWGAAAFSFLVPFLVIPGMAGFMLILQTAVFDPRVMGAFSSALIFSVCIAREAFPRIRVGLILCLAGYLLFAATSMVATFRAVVNQSRFENDMVINMRGDLAQAGTAAVETVSIIGRSPFAPDISPAMRHYPLLGKIIMPSFIENNDFGYYALMKRAKVFVPMSTTTAEMKNSVHVTALSSGCLYRFWIYQKTAIFDFHSPHCQMPPAFMPED